MRNLTATMAVDQMALTMGHAAMPTTYRTNHDKLLEALVLLAELAPGIDVFHAAKCLFYADKWHLNEYGRPVTGDVYVAMDQGPVPSSAYDMVKLNERRLDGEMLSRISEALQITGEHRNLTPRRPANRRLFSRTDIRCIERAVREIAPMEVGELWDMAHAEPAYVAAFREGAKPQPIDYADMIDLDCPDRAEVIEELRESAPYVAL
jgi:hypothetical protein